MVLNVTLIVGSHVSWDEVLNVVLRATLKNSVATCNIRCNIDVESKITANPKSSASTCVHIYTNVYTHAYTHVYMFEDHRRLRSLCIYLRIDTCVDKRVDMYLNMWTCSTRGSVALKRRVDRNITCSTDLVLNVA